MHFNSFLIEFTCNHRNPILDMQCAMIKEFEGYISFPLMMPTCTLKCCLLFFICFYNIFVLILAVFMYFGENVAESSSRFLPWSAG